MVKEVVQKDLQGEISLLNNLINTSEDLFEKLKRAYERDDAGNFNRLKAILIQTQRRISETIR